MVDKPYHDPDVLEQLYTEEGLTQKEIADMFDVGRETIRCHLGKHGIEKDRLYDDPDILDQLYNREDLTHEEIGEMFGVSGTTIGTYLREHGIEKNRPYDDPDVLEQLYIEEGLTQEEIGEMFGVSGTTIGNSLREHGIEKNRPWQDRNILEQYHRSGKTYTEIAETLGTSHQNIHQWFNKFGLDPRHPVRLSIEDGYPRLKDGADKIHVHRLIAVANYGFDALEGMHVHHRNGHRFDNRPTNLDLLTPSEHKELHNRIERKLKAYQVGKYVDPEDYDSHRDIPDPREDYKTLYELYIVEGMTLEAMGEYFGVTGTTIRNWLNYHEISREQRSVNTTLDQYTQRDTSNRGEAD